MATTTVLTRTSLDLKKAILESTRLLGYPSVYEKQEEAICAFIEGHDTFVSLPTGYGKSLIYAVLPLVFDKIRGKVAII